MNRESNITLRVNEAEKAVIYAKAKQFGMKVSDYIRFTAMNTKEIIIEKTANQ